VCVTYGLIHNRTNIKISCRYTHRCKHSNVFDQTSTPIERIIYFKTFVFRMKNF